MLRHIAIRDYAIIDQLEVSLDNGLTVLTGETGAGKSIIVDALGLVLGDRADSGAVRQGTGNAEISASFDLDAGGAAVAWLDANDLRDDQDCILRRVVGADGRSRGFINGRPAPLGQMRELGELLVDIHGQHEHQSLLRRDIQLQLLDAHGGHHPAVMETANGYQHWREADAAWLHLNEATKDRASRLDLLRFQVRELESLGLVEGELEELEVEHTRLANSGRLLEAAQSALMLTDGDDEMHARVLLHQAASALEDVVELDPGLGAIHQMLEQALVNLGEGADDLRRWLDRFDLDPERKTFVEQRIGTAHQLARKYRIVPGELPALLTASKTELDELDHADTRLEHMGKERQAALLAYQKASHALHKARCKAAKALSERITTAMQALGMEGGRFEVKVDHDPSRLARAGGDQIEFLVATNAGQQPRPLAKTASGGELSRISLAIQVSAAHAATIGCLIFDEVDSGVGGAVAEIVGQRLRELANGRQVLCVTHLPQVASQGHHHLRVLKRREADDTHTFIESLPADQRVDELARMLGGVKVTAATRATAREMLASED